MQRTVSPHYQTQIRPEDAAKKADSDTLSVIYFSTLDQHFRTQILKNKHFFSLRTRSSIPYLGI